MAISHRLHSPMDVRPDDEINEAPKRIIFLSVEGNETEKNYFNCVDKYREVLGIQSLVHVEILSRFQRDGKSDPQQVFELLQECISLKKDGILTRDICTCLAGTGEQYSKEDVEKYLNGELQESKNKELDRALQFAQIDLDYQKYLCDFKGENGTDVFAIVIDRDKESHSDEEMKQIFQKCEEKGCKCFLSNPCFEFWLLLHVCDVETELKDKYDDILKNEKISKKHTFVSNELSKIAHHGKSISEGKFKQIYLSQIDTAIKRARSFAENEEDLLNQIGTNIPNLFAILREKI